MTKKNNENNSVVPVIVPPTESTSVYPVGKILQVLQLSNVRLRLRHNDKSSQFTISEHYVRITKKGEKDWIAEKVLEVLYDEAEATIAFIRKVHEKTTELVEQLD